MLSKTEKQKIADFLNKRAPNGGICKECGSNKMSIADHIVQPIIANEGGLTIGGPSYPQVMVVCNNCGSTRYFNAVVMGLLEVEATDD
ncbi:hypothetical protein [Kordiimonas aquimaris]|uniref:hypothetical protein n=1 Tax=Kordiimonas aquimaris TaxID=707591 RepID=UPI0021CDEDD2|nr:hypothetical protein [Kordiimonas aquimaris]